jgi:L-ascorbate metabolism protein UlaG (beta-lactamase superfamily)
MHLKKLRNSFVFISATLLALGAIMLGASKAVAADVNATKDRLPTAEGDLVIEPIRHATLALQWKQLKIYVDPAGVALKGRADLVVITDIHQDHFSVPNLKSLATDTTAFVVSPAVAAQMPAEWRSRTTILTNGQTATVLGIKIEAVAAYNLSPERQNFHPKGRGNGYIMTFADKRVYLSGDTEDTPEVRGLKNIDVAFLCMNLPYTMDVEHAAEAVRAFRPKIVYPYHYRGSDLQKFKRLVGEDAGVEVRLRDWYGKGGAE